MNISPDGKTVRFKTVLEELFLAEKSGAKPNTVRIIDSYDYEQLRIHEPEKIIIEYQREIILRTISHVYVSNMILGKYLAVFSFINYDHDHHPKQKKQTMTSARTIGVEDQTDDPDDEY